MIHMSNVLYVDEIFGPTIQGEGAFCGKPCYFIRLNGCDQNPPCKWCDTLRSYNQNVKTITYIEDIIKELDTLMDKSNVPINRFVITGGNPCAQDCSQLIIALRECYNNMDSVIEINIETQGTVFPAWLNLVSRVVVSPKPPSAMANDTGQSYSSLLSYCFWIPRLHFIW